MRGRMSLAMNTWKDSMVLLGKEWQSDRRYLIWNVVFTVYLGGWIGLMLSGDGSSRSMLGLMDFIFLTVAPITGFFFSKRSFRYLKDDSYTQMLLYYRILPIPLKSVIVSRMLQALAVLVVNGALFYVTLYFSSGGLKHSVHGADYIAFALTWAGVGLIMTGPYIFFEFLGSGIAYLWACFGHMAIAVIAAVIIALFKGNLFSFTVEISGQYGLLSPLMWGCLIAGAAVLALFGRIVMRKLEVRDLV